LRVQQQLGLADPARLATGEILFNMPASHNPETFLLQRVQLAGFPAPDVESDGAIWRIVLPAAARGAASLTVCLDYLLRFPPAPAAGAALSSDNALSWSDLGLVAGYWYPVLAPYSPSGEWVTVPYHPVGDPIVYETAGYSVDVSAPPGYTVAGAGLVEAANGTWRFRLEHARGFAFVVSDRLSVTKALAGDIPVWVYHQPGYEAAGLDAARAAVEAIPLFVQTYGPYPYDEFIVVEAVQFGGMEYSGLITYSSEDFAEYKPPSPEEEFGADFLPRFVVHELGHQWWYGAVGNDQAREPWLDEALARYGEWLYYSRLHPGNLDWWEAPSAHIETKAINQPIYNFADTSSYVQAVYVSGTRFLLAVCALIGEPEFHTFLQQYYAENPDRLVSQAEFLALLRTYTGPALDDLLPIYFDPIPAE